MQNITIGISAYNEEKNIIKIINSLLLQKFTDKFKLSKILVMSDGSSDNTVKLVRSIKSKVVTVIGSKDNKGKPARMNEIFRKTKTEICVIIDADITLKDNYAIQKLVSPLENKSIVLTYGNLDPFTPVNFVQKIIYAGHEVWSIAKKLSKSEMYNCGGPIRAFRKILFKEMKFPEFSADDVYPYLYCQIKGYKSKFVSQILGNYRLPYTFADFYKQTTRFSVSEDIHRVNFGKKLISDNFVIDYKLKIKSYLINLINNPFFTVLNLITIFLFKFLAMTKKKNLSGKWDLATSTKI